MKKIFSVLLTLAMIFCFAACGNEKAEKPGCYVSIIYEGEIKLAAKYVELKDYDKDGSCNLDEVLKAAHESEGKAGDYASASGDYGLYITKLWGNESGAFGYYINNNMSMNLTDTVKENDYVVAYVYTDQTNWSDVYSYFDKYTAEGSEVTLTLNSISFDENYNPVAAPCKGASIQVDGTFANVVTDADGKATVKLSGSGQHIVTAVSEDAILVSPVCVVNTK